MESVFEVLGRYVSPRRRPLFAAVIATAALTVFVVSQLQGLLLPMSKAGATVLVAFLGALVSGGVYYITRQGEESRQEAARLERLNRLKIVPDRVAVTPFYVLHMGSGPSTDGIYGMNRPVVGGCGWSASFRMWATQAGRHHPDLSGRPPSWRTRTKPRQP